MKKVLIISYYFLEETSIGSVRPNGLAKFLPEFGWDPVILTVRSQLAKRSKYRVIETPYEDVILKWKKHLGLKANKGIIEQCNASNQSRKRIILDLFLGLWRELIAYPDINKGWIQFGVSCGGQILSQENFDAIISTSPPETCSIIAKELKIRCKIPWIADMRDLWTQKHNYQYTFVRKIIDKKMEIKTISFADALVTVSLPLSDKLKELHRRKDIYTIPNGFDPDQIIECIPSHDIFRIVYTGNINREKQDLALFLRALKRLCSDSEIDIKDIVVDIYGCNENWLKRDISLHTLEHVVKVHGWIPRMEALIKQRESQMLLLLTWNDPEYQGVYTGKIFEYLAAQRPILSVGPHGDVVEMLLNETKSGIQLSSVEEINKEVKKCYKEFKLCGKVNYLGKPSEINKYNQRELARKFASILDNISNNYIKSDRF